MAWIKTINEDEATQELKIIYDNITKGRGRVSNILKTHSLKPHTMQTHLDLYMSIMFSKSKLSREKQEMVATVVSLANKCPYCINHHVEALNHYWKSNEKVEMFCKDYRKLELGAKESAMLEYSKKLTLKQHDMTEDDINKLRDVGFEDEEILSINLIASYFNFVNRIALGLGVEFTEHEKKGYKY